MLFWKEEIENIFIAFHEYKDTSQNKLQRNWSNISLYEDFDVGEVLGLIYSLKGGYRKI
jgi:hypothetical protein